MIFSGILIGFLGFGVWSHHMFATGMGAVADTAFSLVTMLIAIPTGVKIFNWIATLWGGHIHFKTPLYFAVGMVGLFIIGGLSGIMHASPRSMSSSTIPTSSSPISTMSSSAARSSASSPGSTTGGRSSRAG